jgi:hypothetical protein
MTASFIMHKAIGLRSSLDVGRRPGDIIDGWEASPGPD